MQRAYNLFGMRLPKARKTTAIGKKRHYAVYKDWISSVEDYKHWQNKIPNKPNNISLNHFLLPQSSF